MRPTVSKNSNRPVGRLIATVLSVCMGAIAVRVIAAAGGCDLWL